MKFSYSLLKRLFPRIPKKETLAERLSLHAFEVQGVVGDTMDIKLYANRYSDAASHIGMAREAAAISGAPFKNPVESIVNLPENQEMITASIADPKKCLRYAARCFGIKKVGESPKWMQEILIACGLKPINHVVDLMNYVMLETGQPLHAFDYDKLAGQGKKKQISVRLARSGEKIETLDGQNALLDSETLVIADARGPVAIAGIKGGKESGVHAKTTRIVVEAANFDPVSVYASSRRLGLITDASLRFGHGISPELAGWGIDRVTELLLDDGAELLDSVDVYPRPAGDEVIEFDLGDYEKLMGASVSPATAKKCFEARGFEAEFTKDKKGLLVRVPSWRLDIENFEDLAEEVGRFVGYESLKPKAPQVSLLEAHEEDSVVLKSKLRELLTHYELDEVCNSSFVGEPEVGHLAAYSRLLGNNATPIKVLNPISEDRKYLRPSLGPTLLKNIEDNGRFMDRVRIFEVGAIFGEVRGKYSEALVLGIALGARKEPRLPLELKGLASDFLREIGLQEFNFVPQGSVLRLESDHTVLGFLYEAPLERQWSAAVMEIEVGKLLRLLSEEREYRPLPKYPGAMRDISVLVDGNVRIGDMVEAISGVNKKIIEDVDLVDEYSDPSLGGKQSLTFRFIFQAEDRTLTDSEVNAEMEKVVKLLRDKFGGEVR